MFLSGSGNNFTRSLDSVYVSFTKKQEKIEKYADTYYRI